MKIRVIIKGIVSYIVAIAFCVIFGLFLNADVGWFVLLALILAPVISVFFAWLSSRMLTLSCNMKAELLSKGDTCDMVIGVRNHSIFPTPPVEIVLTGDVRVPCETPSLIVSVMPRSTKEFAVTFTAKICGPALVGLDAVRVTDYLGLFSFEIKNEKVPNRKKKVAVIPDIAEISSRDDNLVKVMQTSLSMDDGDDTIESSVNSFGGFPGYDNREYVPGDPIKRINWKQSAKRNKLLVRLDDEMASKTVNVILDSVMDCKGILFHNLTATPSYGGCSEPEILAGIAQEAVENALGIMQVLVRHNYAVNFYFLKGEGFSKFEIEDESDIESVRLDMADYLFLEEQDTDRLPKEDPSFEDRVGIFSTPNPYEEAYAFLEREAGAVMYTTVFSAVEEAKKLSFDEGMLSLEQNTQLKREKQSLREKIGESVKTLIIPYILALLLSVSVFAIFDTPVISWWTVAEGLLTLGILGFCEYVNRHRVIGSLFTVLLVVGCFRIFASIAFEGDYGAAYTEWFMTGGDSVETTFAHLFSLLVVFTVFFSMVVYYYTVVRYKTSSLLLVSLIPFVAYVKVMKAVDMPLVVLATALNLIAFLVHNRTLRDKGKRIVGYAGGLVSVGLYVALLICIGLSLPAADTKYYYMFENAFLGGNIRQEVPEEYSDMSDFSGNADAFNELNNRKLYEINMLEPGSTIYLKRQTFDLYDFEYDRWYPEDDYGDAVYLQKEWEERYSAHSLALLMQAISRAAEYEPEILTDYGLGEIPTDTEQQEKQIYVDTMNFSSAAFITPPYSLWVDIQKNDSGNLEDIYVSRMGVFQKKDGLLDDNIEYVVNYYEEEQMQGAWIGAGGANFDNDTSLEMLNRVKNVLDTNKEAELAETVESYIVEAKEAKRYKEVCEANTGRIPESVRTLAMEITENCTYDWEKAGAIQKYFRNNHFVYDLSYDAPDDSVEYFLFEGKTGTCSDFASAYVLLARAAGLTVRYAEGFVPKAEYDGSYVVRTNCGHAYPEVYIQNVGYVVYEATQAVDYRNSYRYGNGTLAYFLMAGARVLLVFTMVSAVIVSLLFLHLVAAPFVRNALFAGKYKKASPKRAILLLYHRIQKQHEKTEGTKFEMQTPYEYAENFEKTMHFDICELCFMVEKSVYAKDSLDEREKKRAWEIYGGAQTAMKEQKKQKGKR